MHPALLLFRGVVHVFAVDNVSLEEVFSGEVEEHIDGGDQIFIPHEGFGKVKGKA